jgi:hypothetical protein
MSQLPNHFIKFVALLGSELELYKKFLLVILGMWLILVVATSGLWQAGVVRLSESQMKVMFHQTFNPLQASSSFCVPFLWAVIKFLDEGCYLVIFFLSCVLQRKSKVLKHCCV